MIVRIWRGRTKREDRDAYTDYVRRTGLAGYAQTAGNRGVALLRRDLDNETEFVTVSYWDNLEAIQAFSGSDVNRAVFYPEDDRYLTQRDLTVTHFELVEGDPLH
jgi:heme-degrading monooxygenase HmoA